MAGIIIGDNGKTNEEKERKLVKKQRQLWNEVESEFWLSKLDILDTRRYLLENMAAIAGDNLKGQCTKEHSCIDSAKDILKKIANNFTRQEE